MGRFAVYLGQSFPLENHPGNSTLEQSYNLADWLEPVAESVVCNGEIGELRCRSNKHVEAFYAGLSLGQAIQVIDTSPPGEDSDSDQPSIFDGVIVKLHIVIVGKEELTEVVAYSGGDDLFRRVKLHGQVRLNHANEQSSFNAGLIDGAQGIDFSSDVIVIDTPLCFNPDSEPNATAQTWFNNGTGSGGNNNTFPIFEAPFRNQINASGDPIKAVYWTLSDAIQYLLNIYPCRWAISPASYADAGLELFTTYGNPVVSAINCEGDSLAGAFNKLLTPHNYGFWIEPSASSADSPPLHRIHFFSKGNGTTNTLKLSARGTAQNASDANLIQCDLTFDATPVVNDIYAYGDRIQFTTLAHTNPTGTDMKLVKGWKDSDLVIPTVSGLVNPYDTTFRSSYCNPQLVDPVSGAYGAGRYWIVNLGENGNYNIENLSADLPAASGQHTSVDLRPFEKPQLYTQTSAGGQLQQEDIVVEMSLDSGDQWNIVEKDWYKTSKDGMGIVFVTPYLERLGILYNQTNTPIKTYWQALNDSTLQIRILCSVKSDERVNNNQPNAGDSFPLAVQGIYNNDGYKRIIYNSAIDSTVYYTNFPPLQVTQNDTTALLHLAQTQVACSDRIMISGRAQVLFDFSKTFGEYAPGQSITGIANRAIAFAFNPTVMKVVYKFPDQQVEIILDNHKVPSLMRSKALTSAENMQQHKLGISGGVSPLQGGNKVPYLPGVESSRTNYYKNGGQ